MEEKEFINATLPDGLPVNPKLFDQIINGIAQPSEPTPTRPQATPIMSKQHKYTTKPNKPKHIKHRAAHEYARNAKHSIPISDFMEMFPMRYTSAISILKRWNRHMPASKKKVEYVECNATLDKSINYNDNSRRSVVRERLRGQS